MSYGHAHELLASGAKSPAAELRVAVRRLRQWADLNPKLMPLYLDFEACLRDLDKYLEEHGGREILHLALVRWHNGEEFGLYRHRKDAEAHLAMRAAETGVPPVTLSEVFDLVVLERRP